MRLSSCLQASWAFRQNEKDGKREWEIVVESDLQCPILLLAPFHTANRIDVAASPNFEL